MRSLLLVLAAVPLAAGCADVLPPERGTTAPLVVRQVAAPVTAVVVPKGGADVLVLTRRVPAGGAGCGQAPEGLVTDFDRETLRLQTAVGSNGASYCTTSRLLTFTAKVALRGRRLIVNGRPWGPTATGFRLTPCSTDVGCSPPQDRCDPVWTSTLTPHFDLPPAKQARVVACRGRWLVMDVAAASGVHRRWFAVLDMKRRWQVVASSAVRGCGAVRRTVPAFPPALCRDLSAP